MSGALVTFTFLLEKIENVRRNAYLIVMCAQSEAVDLDHKL